jgi:hypothetical protein
LPAEPALPGKLLPGLPTEVLLLFPPPPPEPPVPDFRILVDALPLPVLTKSVSKDEFELAPPTVTVYVCPEETVMSSAPAAALVPAPPVPPWCWVAPVPPGEPPPITTTASFVFPAGTV